MFGDERFWLVFLFIPPLLTMRLFAEERSSGTLEMLMTAPLRDWQVVSEQVPRLPRLLRRSVAADAGLPARAARPARRPSVLQAVWTPY